MFLALFTLKNRLSDLLTISSKKQTYYVFKT